MIKEMKTIAKRNERKQLANEMSQHDCKRARLQQPQTTQMYKGRGGREGEHNPTPARN